MVAQQARMKSFTALVAAAAGAAVTLLGFGLAMAAGAAGALQDRPSEKSTAKDRPPADQPKVKLGLVQNDPKAFRGYTLLNPMNTKTAYLIDMEGRVVKQWKSEHNSMHAAHILANGNLFRVAALSGADRAFGAGPGAAGIVQEFGWDGDLVWDFRFHNDKQYPHHDAIKMPSGNVLMVVWDKKTADQAIAAGRKKELVGDYVLPDSVLEIKPTGQTTGEVVWEWHLWDHLVQDHDATKANYGDVVAHPELVDINFVENPMGPGPGPGGGKGPGPGPQVKVAKAAGPPPDAKSDPVKKAEAEKLKSIGYVGSPQARSQRVNPDWTHVNSVDYNPALDQIMISVHEFSEIWIIDHSTTTAQAAGHSGGRAGKGGDLLYRWGNPHVYRAGTKADQTLFAQHNAQWIPPGIPGEGHMLVFNNGGHRPDGSYTSVDEVVLPVDSQGQYAHQPGAAYGPKQAIWSYSAPKKSDFYAFFISGTHRLPNGDTMICSGPNGTLFEVTPEKEMVWKYVNPVKGGFGPGGFGGPPRPGQVLPRFLQDMLGLSDQQKKEIDALEKNIETKLDTLLTADQNETLRQRSMPGPGNFGAMPPPGQIMSVSTQVVLKATAEQKTQLTDLQKTVEATLEKVMTADQRKQLKQTIADFARGGPPGGPGGPPGGPGGPGGGPPPMMFAGPPGGSAVFRAYRYGPDFPGLAGRDLKPGKTVEELQPKEPEKTKGTRKTKEPA
jgi:Arylsulfotransferase (ASST)